MQALAGLFGHCSKLLETYSGIDQISKDQPCCIGFTIEKKRCRLIQERSCKLRLASNALYYRQLEISRETHRGPPFFVGVWAFFLALYSSCSATAWSIARCWFFFELPPKSTTRDSPSFAR